MSQIHPTCIVSPDARIGHGVTMGPYCIVEPNVTIGDNCKLESRVTIKSGTELGKHNYVAEGSVLGGLPQHKCPTEPPGKVVVGDGNVIRENVTIHRGLTAEKETVIGSHSLLMVNAHIAHDCHVSDHVILANNVMLAGHISVGERAYLSGGVAVHQFCRIGEYAMVGGQAHVTKDIPPFVTVDGVSTKIVGLNLVGLKRAGFDRDELRQLKIAYRLAFRSGLRWQEMLEQLAAQFPTGRAARLHQFMTSTERGCVQERSVPKGATLRLHLPDASAGEAGSEVGDDETQAARPQVDGDSETNDGMTRTA